MRIVGGTFRGKKLALPTDKRIRPTGDRTREALFNILSHGSGFRTDRGALPIGAHVLDVFSGTGALGLEALSRGAEHVTFMDNHADSLRLVKANVAALGCQRQASILNRDGTRPGRAARAMDLILMDPPYGLVLENPCLQALNENGWISPETLIVIEQTSKEKNTDYSGFETLDVRKYGAALLTFLKRSA
ncbi:16S rRNA (guanine(966)-N(2))-methyltransferase RsmD [Sneathiella chinensis]|uniref:DNA methyltransferase n=1 Tax=Sneathiella chinensis TaxID=349750 RepID=A0ABQ5U1E9_9PROT|nr:16S rRNA (guanine(966)-N(2))-methyltransferase RsmD [Sneathiella chinensis]GLQ05648.1 DNA methyltransferase [Sneathiella chinensis]